MKLRLFLDDITQELQCWDKRNLSKAKAKFLALAEAADKALTHMVKWSIAMSIYRLLSFVVKREPIMSIITTLKVRNGEFTTCLNLGLGPV